jgi:hypothetical protein
MRAVRAAFLEHPTAEVAPLELAEPRAEHRAVELLTQFLAGGAQGRHPLR